jgi:hypothetical protein
MRWKPSLNKISALNNVGLVFEALKAYDTAIKYYDNVRQITVLMVIQNK